MTLAWPAKDPGEDKDYGIDWTTRLGGDPIASSAWSLPVGITQATPAPSFTATSTTIWLSGGTSGTTYTLTNTVTTTGGRTFVEVVTLLAWPQNLE